MNKIFSQFKQETIKVDLAGKSYFRGSLIDSSKEILVLFDGKDFIYIPMIHVENITVAQNEGENIQMPLTLPSFLEADNQKELTLDEMLTQSQGIYTEIYVANRQPIHGLIDTVMSDYFIFHSPIYKTIYISKQHLKWLIPYPEQKKPYDHSTVDLQMGSKNSRVSHFEALIASMVNKLVIFNLGEHTHHIGKLVQIHGKMVELRTARGNTVLLNIQHIKSLHEV
ncbi:DUF2642 domain-containing protein [Lysinibacillus antri]|uniref:DUF2642 domain-containing protein n=1 Tax=Lysinibacillus antri TaxID=2498145 RepID=A0A3S0RLS1_9BACI|nr:DUF2642 domain-containing protein [Lysinibacillus antri]RUL56856.1 DUF2642 domain-containing protein [Lysinibacillus antri]